MFKIFAKGHENITARHKTTLEITKEKELSPRGDCIIGVRADKSVRDIPDNFKKLLRGNIKFEFIIDLPDYGLRDVLTGYGSEKLSLTHASDTVIRKSSYTCPRTLLVYSNKAAKDIDREIVELLKDKKTEIVVMLRPLETVEGQS